MARLEAKDRMSPVQLAIVIFMIMVAAPGTSLAPILKAAGHAAWLSVLAGAAIFYGAAWLMLKLGEAFPQESVAEYLPRLWGALAGRSSSVAIRGPDLFGGGLCASHDQPADNLFYVRPYAV